jgi:hypothetical protein
MFESDLLSGAFYWRLSRHSPDWYEWDDDSDIFPPPLFCMQIAQAGSSLGWSWCTFRGHHSCEINWLDPEPSSESTDCEAYLDELQRIEHHAGFYRGYHQPSTQEEYRRLCKLLA